MTIEANKFITHHPRGIDTDDFVVPAGGERQIPSNSPYDLEGIGFNDFTTDPEDPRACVTIRRHEFWAEQVVIWIIRPNDAEVITPEYAGKYGFSRRENLQPGDTISGNKLGSTRIGSLRELFPTQE